MPAGSERLQTQRLCGAAAAYKFIHCKGLGESEEVKTSGVALGNGENRQRRFAGPQDSTITFFPPILLSGFGLVPTPVLWDSGLGPFGGFGREWVISGTVQTGNSQ